MKKNEVRVKCPNGHWVTVETILATDLRTAIVRHGQRCPSCGATIR